jgi:cytochrome c oxidase assembly factor CtaG
MPNLRIPRSRVIPIVIALLAAFGPAAAYAHGPAGPEPTVMTLITGWQFDPLFFIPAALVTWFYIEGVRRVNRLHPKSPFPRKRVTYFMMGIGALVLALASPIARYDTDLFFVHMIQHMLIMMIAAPLLLLGTPITLILRAATPTTRRQVLLPILHSRVLRAVSFPVLAWFLLAVSLWLTHYSAIFNIALEILWILRLEHMF